MPKGGAAANAAAPAAPPTTDLADQLNKLAVRQQVDQGRRHRGRASLLYTFQEAADIDGETIYRIGLEGLEQLTSLDARFQPFRRTLFGGQALDRDASTQEVNARLDAAVAAFCDLLSPYFLLEPAFKALEHLMRKYKVHERNVDALMAAALPYHETPQFVRLVQALRLEPRSLWAFLEPMQGSGAPAPRETLVLRCLTDRGLLRFVCETAQRQGDPQRAGRVFPPFYAALLCEYIAKLRTVDEPLVTMLLPYLLKGLAAAAAPDHRAATYTVVGRLAARATFTEDLVNVLVVETCRSATPALLRSALLLLAVLAGSQQHLRQLPDKGLAYLARSPGLVEELAAMAERGLRVHRLLGLLAGAALRALPADPAQHEPLLLGLLTKTSLGPDARGIAEEVLRQAAATYGGEPEAAAAAAQLRGPLLRALRALDLRCPAELDAAVDALLPPQAPGPDPASEAAADMEVEARPDGGDAQQGQRPGDERRPQEQEGRRRLLAALGEAFEGTARCPLDAAGTTVLLAAEAPAAAVRRLAVERLDALAASPAADGAAAAAAVAALLRRLQDDSPEVALAALSAPSLLQAPPAALLDGLAECFERAMDQASNRNGRKAQRAAARGVARKVVKLAAGPLAEAAPALLPRTLPLLLAAALVGPAAGRKVAATAAKAAGKLPHPLLAALADVQLPGAEGGDGEAVAAAAKGGRPAKRAGSKKAAAETQSEEKASKAEADRAYNAQALAALAARAADDADAAAALAAQLAPEREAEAGSRHAAPVALLVAHAALRRGGDGSAALAAALVRQLAAAGGPAASSQLPPADALPAECFLEDGLPTVTLLDQFTGGRLDLAALHSSVVLAALAAAPWALLAPRGSRDLLPLARVLCTLRWRPALSTLAARMAAEGHDAALLLSSLFATPPGAEEEGVQLAALQHAAAVLHQRRRGGGKKGGAVGSNGDVALLGRALCTLCHPSRAVRQAAAELAQVAAPADRAGKAAAATLADAAAGLAADAEAAPRLLALMLGSEEPSEQQGAYVLPAADADSLGSALLAAAAAEAAAAGAAGRGAAALAAAHTSRLLLDLLADWAAPAALLGCAAGVLAAARKLPADGAEGREREALLAAAGGCFTSGRLEELLQPAPSPRRPASNAGKHGNAVRDILAAWCALLEPVAGDGGLAAARLAALRHLRGTAYAALPPESQQECLEVLLRAASQDGDDACRAAARDALGALPLHAATLAPLLALPTEGGHAHAADTPMADAAAEEGQEEEEEEEDEELQRLQAEAAAATAAASAATPRGGRRGSGAAQQRERAALAEAAAEAVERRRAALRAQRAARSAARRAAEGGDGAAAAAAPPLEGVQRCAAALELLLWKEDVSAAELVVAPVQQLLSQLLDQLAAAAAAEQAAAEGDGDGGEAPAAAEPLLPPAEAVYLLQLCLSMLAGVARRHGAAAGAAAPASPPPPAAKGAKWPRGRKAAAAQQQQQEQQGGAAPLDLRLAVRAAQAAPDGAARTAALELVALLAAGMPQGALDLVLDVVAAAGDAAALQQDEHSERVAAQALQAILPAWTGAGRGLDALSAAVVAALPRAAPSRRLPLLSALVSALPQVEGLCSVLALLLEQAVRQQAPAAAAGGDADMVEAGQEEDWAADLAGDLLEQAPLLLQASVSAALLEHSLAASRQQPWQPLPLLAVAFVTQQLEARRGAASAASAEELGDAYRRLLAAALQHLQALGERQAAAARGKGGGAAAAPPSLLRAGTAGCYRLLRALRAHMPPSAFLFALAALAADTPADRVRRKALQLLASAAREAAEDASFQEDGEEAAAAADAALAACDAAVALLRPGGGGGSGGSGDAASPLTRQTALTAVGTVAAAFGSSHQARLLAMLPPVLSATADTAAAVRGSALAATASIAVSLGPRLVPQLPAAVAAVLAAVASAAAAVAAAAAAAPEAAAAAAAAGDSDSGGDDEAGGGRARRGGVGEAAALELAAALAAAAALVEHLGAFLAPHLPQLLQVLLHPAILQCKAARCSDAAAAIRRRLAAGVPTRLLLPPLLAQVEPSAEAGPESACALLAMLRGAVDAMDAAAVAAHHEAAFAALLRALDLRRRRPPALANASGGIDRVEAAAVAALVALTLRLTEARFKPLFFRLLEWAEAVPEGDAGLPLPTARLLRSVALFSLVNALAERLRGVFVPYYGLLLDAALAHLAGSAAAAEKPGRKKKRKASEGAAAADGAADHPLHAEHDWRLRLKVVRALHRCLLYDTGAAGAPRFLDEPRFQRLLPPLVAHLGLSPPPAAAAAMQPDHAADGAAELEASLQGWGDDDSGDGGDAFGRAVAACLAQLAVTAGSDALWKPLNHQVLMMTRSLEPRTRLLALKTAAQVVERLAEEYLALLPETLPFLAELLEDPEQPVEAAAAALVRRLEELSGESLEQYLR